MKLQKAFTLIELLIVIIIIGILSTLLFRTLADMLTANARIQQEKIMTQELMTIQTTINNISEHYPIIDTIYYEWLQNGFIDTLYLRNNSWSTVQIYSTGSCDTWSWCYLAAQIDTNEEIQITQPDRSTVSGIKFKILPIEYYTGIIYDNLALNKINAQGFWIFWNLSYKNNKSDNKARSSYNLQHFIHLQQ